MLIMIKQISRYSIGLTWIIYVIWKLVGLYGRLVLISCLKMDVTVRYH